MLGLIGAVGVAGKSVISDNIPLFQSLSQITSNAESRVEKVPVRVKRDK